MGLRSDGRGSGELRPVTIETGYLKECEGSVLIQVGNTKLICSATLEESVPPFLKGMKGGWVTAEYAMLPRSAKRRIPRERRGVAGRHQEIQRLIGRSLRAVCDLDVLPQVTFILDCDVIQADGGTRGAGITGSFCALHEAVNCFMKKGVIQMSPLLDFCCGVSVGIVDGEVLLDLTQEEDSRADVDLNLALTGNLEMAEIQGTAEGKPFSQAKLSQMIELAKKGASQLIKAQREALSELLV